MVNRLAARPHAGRSTLHCVIRSCTFALAIVLSALLPGSALAGKTGPWPPANGPGVLFAHFGEEHINDDDGATILPKVVRVVTRYDPALVTMSGDKANNGTTEQLQLWRDVMRRFDRAGIPWYAGIGNHDRYVPTPGLEGFPLVNTDFGPYRELFADRPYPAGDADEYPGKLITHDRRPAGDPDGAASHYFVDAGPVRWIFIDNSCWSISFCEPFEFPSAQTRAGETQFEFFERVATGAQKRGLLAFVVMHMPTRDPRDQSYTDVTAMNHTMGKGITAPFDNDMFEDIAETTGVDGVFVGHIKGQFLYEGPGDIPYFIDGGAGGELYTTGPVGTDHGYWHGFRLLRVRGQRFTTDTVPIFVPNSIRIASGKTLARGRSRTFEAFGRQPVFHDPAKVEMLELRDPDPIPSGGGQAFTIPPLVLFAGPPLAVLLLIAIRSGAFSARRRRVAVPVLAAAAGMMVVGISGAQQSEPTSTPVESLPNPARMWTSSNPLVLRPVASKTDDPRRRVRAQTADGKFVARCPGRSRLTIASGFAKAAKRIRVPSRKGPIVRSVAPGSRAVERGRKTTVASVRLAQRARIVATVHGNGGRVALLARRCARAGRPFAVRWNGKGASRGRYSVVVRVLSDRRPVVRRFAFNVR